MSEVQRHWERIPRPVRGVILLTAVGATAFAAFGPKSHPVESRPDGLPSGATLAVGVVCEPFKAKVDASTSGDNTLISCTAPEGVVAKVRRMTALDSNNTDPSRLSGIIRVPEQDNKDHTFDCIGNMGQVTMRLLQARSSTGNVVNSSDVDGVGCI
jgi:hypothetical protein